MPIEISWIDKCIEGNATDDCATPKGERERGEGGDARTETRGDGEHTPTDL
jgi:hypothetical protein